MGRTGVIVDDVGRREGALGDGRSMPEEADGVDERVQRDRVVVGGRDASSASLDRRHRKLARPLHFQTKRDAQHFAALPKQNAKLAAALTQHTKQKVTCQQSRRPTDNTCTDMDGGHRFPHEAFP